MANREEDPLTPLVDEYMLKRDKPEFRKLRIGEVKVDLLPRVRPPGRLSPSKICGCERQAVFAFLGVKGATRVDPELENVAESGTWLHLKWGFRFQDMERVLGSDRFQCLSLEESISIPSLLVAGSLDTVLYLKIRNRMRKVVLDVKTITRRGFDWIYQKREPKEAHVKQLLAYMKAKRIRRGILLYECRDDGRFYCFYVEFGKEEWVEVSEWCKRIISKMEKQELPRMHPECEHGKFLYDTCPWRQLCWGRKTNDDKVERQVYEGFPGVEILWQRGNELAIEN